MKMVINRCYGGFFISDWCAAQLNIPVDKYGPEYFPERNDPKFVELVKNHPDKVSGRMAKLKVVSIPDNATDWQLHDYDGAESIIYVVDGKIHWA